MKKLILFFVLAAVAVMTGCQGKALWDYECRWYFEIENRTKSNVTFSTDVLTIVIPPGETKEIYYAKGEVADNSVDLFDFFSPQLDYQMFGSPFHLKVGDEFMPETIWIRRFWYFTSEPLRGTYTLLLTHEFIELLEQLN